MITLATKKDKKELKKHALELIKNGDIEGLRILIYDLKDTNFKVHIKRKVFDFLYAAIEEEYVEIVKYLIESNQIHANNANHLFYYACSANKLETAKYLFNLVKINTHSLNLALVNTCATYYLPKDAKEIDREKRRAQIKFLVESGAQVPTHDNHSIRCIARGNDVYILEYLIQHGADIHTNNNDCLIQAAFASQLETVEYLINLKKDYFINNPSVISFCINSAPALISNYLKEEFSLNATN